MKHWPLSRMVIATRRLELRWPSDADIDALAECAVSGMGEPGYYMPFWTDGTPAAVARSVVQRCWETAGVWRPDDWTLGLAVVHGGEVIGCQTLGARDFVALREGLVTAWFDHRHHGKGFGTESRAAVLQLAFSELGAADVLTVVRQENRRSLGVAHRLGFAFDGVQHNTVRGRRVACNRLRLTRERWETMDRETFEIRGLEGCEELFGLLGGYAPQAEPDPISAVGLSGVRYVGELDESMD